MASNLRKVLETFRRNASSQTEMGTFFERLVKKYFENDNIQKQHYSKVWKYSDWAEERGYSRQDTGIDLVAKNSDGDGYTAIQCKFYAEDNAIKKEDIDSFVSAAFRADFTRLILVDTSSLELGKNAQTVFDNLDRDWNRIQVGELENSQIDWLTFVREERLEFQAKKELRDHQIQALRAVKEGLSKSDRGRLIMACGTGKTFTSLRIAEDIAGKGKLVLYMVPSLALMSQTVREWKNDAEHEFTAFSACSDTKVGRRRGSDDIIEMSRHDLAFPATTDPRKLAEQIERADKNKMTVVFSTYHSIEVISKAQKVFGLGQFDLIVCDEAHRTTGVTLVGEDESSFVRIHSNENVDGAKRLYMTATQRIYTENAKKKVEGEVVTLASMDDEEVYGEVLFHRNFGWAVENNLLTDYKVIVLIVDENLVSERVQKSFEGGGSKTELKLDDATKMVGCYKALAKIGFKDNKNEKARLQPMRRALAFCRSIKLSETFTEQFMNVVNEYRNSDEIDEEFKTDLTVELDHVDGTFNADQRNKRLNWLKDETHGDVCRILSNARCLAEGVDVPALDAVLFLHPRKSQIEVVQSVGRVMRKAEGKELGFVILPVTVAPGVSPERTLNDNKKFSVIWQVLNALRAHDERLDSTVNKIGLGEDVSNKIEIVGLEPDKKLDPTKAKVDNIRRKSRNLGSQIGDDENKRYPESEQLSFTLTEISKAIKAKIVDKCGTRDYWENWAHDIADIAKQHETRINGLLRDKSSPTWKVFNQFHEEIKDDLNPEIKREDVVEMLTQHLITKPVFDALFQGNQFTEENPISKALQNVLERLYISNIDSEQESSKLRRFYKSVAIRAEGIETARGRQKLILELYERFFKKAFPHLTEKLGIVYTPTEAVDYIIHSVEDVLNNEFGKSLGSKGVHILDPFAGTGTFVTRLLQSGIISKQDLPYKYKNEIHANEILLLADYISCINIEAVYHDLVDDNQYTPFGGMVLTDTFQLYEQERDMVADLLPDNSEKRIAQREKEITVVFGNPPYSVGQKDAGDRKENTNYPNLSNRISQTYGNFSTTKLKRNLHDSYIRAIRWATDRIGNEGVVAFISGAAWIDRSFADGMRKSIAEEFDKVYILYLRGDVRKDMLSWVKEEGDNFFGSGSMTGIAITILVKNRDSKTQAKIYFKDIGKNLRRSEKLKIVKELHSVNQMKKNDEWELIVPNNNYEWINQRDNQFEKFISIISKSKPKELELFNGYSLGVSTNRDDWVINYSPNKARLISESLIENYNQYITAGHSLDEAMKAGRSVKWSLRLKKWYRNGRSLSTEKSSLRTILYRPFTKTVLVDNPEIIEAYGKNTNLFPTKLHNNLVIAVSGLGSRSGFSVLMSDKMLNLDAVEKAQCLPLNWYTSNSDRNDNLLLKNKNSQFLVKDGISDEGYKRFTDFYQGKQFSKEDLFYYIYGLLHSPEYRTRFANNLRKELPRIAIVKRFDDFLLFSNAGRKLASFHVNYDEAEPYPVLSNGKRLEMFSDSDNLDYYRVEKMKFRKIRNGLDKSVVIYNRNITMESIPLAAYDYIIYGKPALKWIMDTQCVKPKLKSGIFNDANDYAQEVMQDPAYPLKLFQRVITVSLETMKIVRGLPKLDID